MDFHDGTPASPGSNRSCSNADGDRRRAQLERFCRCEFVRCRRFGKLRFLDKCLEQESDNKYFRVCNRTSERNNVLLEGAREELLRFG